MQKEISLPIKLLKYYSQKYPNIWKDVEKIRRLRGKDKNHTWPSWCFCPMYNICSILNVGDRISKIVNGKIIVDEEKFQDLIFITALAPWRSTKGVYKIHEEIFDSLAKTPITGEIPIDILYYLPEWCVYIEVPPNTVFNPKIKGFFGFLDYDTPHLCPRLHILVDFGDYFSPFELSLFKGSIRSNFEKGKEIIKGDSKLFGYLPEEEKKLMPSEYMENNVEKVLSPFISILLYLCSEASDIKDLNGNSIQRAKVKVAKEFTNLPLQKSKVWEVGYRVGPTLNAAKSQPTQPIEPGNVNESDSPNNLNGVRPHVRRAHYHGYWVGSGQEKKFILKWLHPILVGTKNPDEIVTTSREVL